MIKEKKGKKEKKQKRPPLLIRSVDKQKLGCSQFDFKFDAAHARKKTDGGVKPFKYKGQKKRVH